MTISDAYFRLLDHLGQTRPVIDLLGDESDIVALRHDVDHDLDLALELAFWEHRLGYRASYYLLPSASYWKDDHQFDEKILQLADYGHEVGLHLNGLAEWADGRIDDISGSLHTTLTRLRQGGLTVVGSAAHGDRACYAHGVINNWVFSDLRPTDPESEPDLSAEGVPSPDPAFRIPYSGDVVTRDDGSTFPLWSVSMAELGLSYEAVRLPMDGYFSDSGGSWTRSPDPMTRDLTTGRHQVLLHPEYYRASPRMTFVLSTARSGSKWLAQALDAASSATTSHEYTLNHRLDSDGNAVKDHRTGEGFADLAADPEATRDLVAHARAIRQDIDRDHVECNVYLPHCLDAVHDVFPDAALLHLHRDPHSVLRSLLNRQWYDTPFDRRHPIVDIDGWEGMTQVEKCCAYISATNLDLRWACLDSIQLESVQDDPDSLIEVFADRGIAVHRRLLQPHLHTVVDPNRASFVKAPADWDDSTRRAAVAGLALVRRALNPRGRSPLPRQAMVSQTTGATPVVVMDGSVVNRMVAVGCDLSEGPPTVITTDPSRHGYVLLGGGTWYRTADEDGWQIRPGAFVTVELSAEFDEVVPATIFGLTYAKDRSLVPPRRLSPLKAGATSVAFSPRQDGARWNVAIHVPATGDSTGTAIRLLAIKIKEHPPTTAT